MSLRTSYASLSSVARCFLWIGILWLSLVVYIFLVGLAYDTIGGFTTEVALILRIVRDVLTAVALLSLLYPAMIIKSRALLYGVVTFLVTMIINAIILLILYGYGYSEDPIDGIKKLLMNPQTKSVGAAITILLDFGGLLLIISLILLLVGLYKFSDLMGEYLIVLGWITNLIRFSLGTLLIGIGFIHIAKNIKNTTTETSKTRIKNIISNQLEKRGVINIKDIEKQHLIPRAVLYVMTTRMIEKGELNATIDGLNIMIAPQSQTKI